MKKICKVFLCIILFASVFALVSCGNVSDSTATNGGVGGNTPSPSSSNSVKFTLPSKNVRSASAGSAGDVDYYNVYINRQSFENAQPGTEIKSAPIVVGTQVTVTVEAYGQAKDETGATVMQNSRIAYYTTTLSMPSSPVSLNIKMSEYKTMWYKVTLAVNQFGGRTDQEEYVADGSSHTLPDYGTYQPPNGIPQKHTGWRMYDGSGSDTPPFYPVGASVPITGDTQFELVYDPYATVTILAKYDSWNGGGDGPDSVNNTIKYVAKGDSFLLENYGTFESGTNGENVYRHLNWTVNNKDYNFGESIKIENDIEITSNFIRGIFLMVDVQNFYDQIGSDHYAVDMTSFNGTAYIRKNEDDEITGVFVFKNQPFIFPKAMRTLTDGADWHDVEEWQYSTGSTYPYTDTYAKPGQTIILNDSVYMYSNFSIIERTN